MKFYKALVNRSQVAVQNAKCSKASESQFSLISIMLYIHHISGFVSCCYGKYPTKAGWHNLSHAVMLSLLRVILGIILRFRLVQEKKPSRRFYSPWLAFLPLYMIYESAINIYFFYMAWTARLENRDTFIMRAYGVSALARSELNHSLLSAPTA